MSRAEDLVERPEGMRDACNDAVAFVTQIDQVRFGSDRMAQHALAMALQRIGEAARVMRLRYSDFVASQPQLAWRELAGLRNVISHDYGAVNFDRLWLDASERLPKLAEQISSALDALSRDRADTASRGS
jgi:uncharacterized protein with HEPN domain